MNVGDEGALMTVESTLLVRLHEMALDLGGVRTVLNLDAALRKRAWRGMRERRCWS